MNKKLLIGGLALSMILSTVPVNTANAKEEVVFVNYQQAKCNMTTYILMNAEAYTNAIKNHEESNDSYNEYIDQIIEDVKESERESQREAEVHKYLVNLLAHLIWNETGILGKLSMYYTGSVALNRMKHWYYPDTLYGVIYQSGQYAVTWTELINRPCPQEAYDIAEDLLTNGSVLPEDVVYQAQFKQGSSVYAHIGNTYYCRW